MAYRKCKRIKDDITGYELRLNSICVVYELGLAINRACSIISLKGFENYYD